MRSTRRSSNPDALSVVVGALVAVALTLQRLAGGTFSAVRRRKTNHLGRTRALATHTTARHTSAIRICSAVASPLPSLSSPAGSAACRGSPTVPGAGISFVPTKERIRSDTHLRRRVRRRQPQPWAKGEQTHRQRTGQPLQQVQWHQHPQQQRQRQQQLRSAHRRRRRTKPPQRRRLTRMSQHHRQQTPQQQTHAPNLQYPRPPPLPPPQLHLPAPILLPSPLRVRLRVRLSSPLPLVVARLPPPLVRRRAASPSASLRTSWRLSRRVGGSGPPTRSKRRWRFAAR